ncbi:MAG: DUF4054 domain-containing protein [Desulfovibrionaceae bacterium]|nr:DUF4054 domain-containing protein [Desulfovibrionaceae bacterium]
MLSVEGFRESFPHFTEALFPDGRVRFYLKLAGKRMSAERWDDLFPEGMGLFVAHHLTLEAEVQKATDGSGGINAAAGAVVSESESKTVGGVSKSKSVTRAGSASSGDPLAGQWNLTIYGQQYWQLVQLVGAGGAVV